MKKNTQNIAWTSATIIISTILFIFFQERENRRLGKATSISSVDYWEMFAGISKERKYIEEASAYYRVPIFTPELLAHSGKEVKLTGYYLPYSRLDTVIIISRFPNASCFFCGQAGIESVAMVQLGEADQNSYWVDQLLTVRGTLFLNDTNANQLAFVITDAKVERLIK